MSRRLLPSPARRAAAALLVLVAAAAPALAQPAALAPPDLAQDLDVPFVTTPDNVVLRMLELAGVRADDRLIDLGSGDGRIVITAALRFKVAGLGVEIDPSLVRLSQANADKAGVAALARFAVQDLFDTDLSQASVITMYLLPDVNLQLRRGY